MKVILNTDVKGQGKKGQLVNVSDGYARNFLFPKNLAVEANNQNINVMNTQKKAKDFQLAEEKKAAEELKDKMSKLTVTVHAKAGTGGRLFGAVTSKEISDELKKAEKIEIDKRKILLHEPIKAFGEYIIEIKLYSELSAKVKVVVCE